MHRREFLQAAGAGLAAGAVRAAAEPFALGFNTYSLRALRWDDARMLDYAAENKYDAVFLQDSPDEKTMDPAHWRAVGEQARRLGLRIETGGGAILPRSVEQFEQSVATLRRNIERAKAMGSPFVRGVLASERAALPPGPLEQHMEMAVRVLKAVRQQALDNGLKIVVEVHKDLLAWEHRQVIEAAGRDFVGTYMDTGNPAFVLEHPLTTLETLAPYICTFHLRDSVIYEHPRGLAVQWVPLGEGCVDFQEIVTRAGQLCAGVTMYVKPITGRPPQVIPYLEPDFWRLFPEMRAADLARLLQLARKGRPYEGHVVQEDLAGRALPEAFRAAVEFQQREHLERSTGYARRVLGLGRRWRS